MDRVELSLPFKLFAQNLHSLQRCTLALCLVLMACGGKTDDTAATIQSPNASTTTTTTTLPPDVTPPAAVTITSPASNPYSSNETNFTISGTCEPGATVLMTGDFTQNATCTLAGTFSFPISENVDRAYIFQFKQRDAASNLSTTVNFTWNRNTGIPSPTITSPSGSPFYSKLNNLTISGTCINGDTIRLSGDSNQSVVCSLASFSFTVSSAVDGSKSYSLLQEDNLANTSPSVPQVWVRDTVAPLAPAITSPSSNPFTSADSNLSIMGTCESGATVNLTGDVVSSQACVSSAFNFPISKNVDGAYNFTLSQTDIAGNASSNTSFQWNRNTSIPATPVISSPASSPTYSNSNSLSINGSCVTGDTVSLAGDSTQSQVCTGSGFSFTVTETVDATYSFSISQRDPNTLIDSASVSLTWIRDTVVPAALSLVNPSSSPTYSSSNLLMNGTCETAATVNLTGDDSQTASCVNSAFSFTIVKSIDATYNFSLSQTDLAGNTSSSIVLQWIRDSSIAPAPSIATPASNPFNSNVTSLTLSGGCITGYTVTLAGVTAGEVTNPAGSLTETCSSSTYSFTILKATDGKYNLSVKQTSPSLISSSAASLQWNLDTTPPDTSFVSTPTNPILGTSSTFSFKSTESGSFACSLDGAAFTACTSPLTLSSLANGSHTFQIKATDAVGNTDPSPASYTWTTLSGNTLALYHLDSANPTLDSGSYISPYQNNLSDASTTNNASGKFSQARTLNGSSQYLSAPHSASLALLTTRMTAEAFAMFTSLPASRAAVVAKMGASGQMSWELGIKKQGANYRAYFIGSTDGSTTTEIQSANLSAAQQTSLTAGYVHLAVTWDQGAVKVYLDGTQVAAGTIGSGTVALFNNSTTPLTIGVSNSTNYFSGSIDEVRISNIVRWSAGFTVPSAAYTAD